MQDPGEAKAVAVAARGAALVPRLCRAYAVVVEECGGRGENSLAVSPLALPTTTTRCA